MSAHLLTTPLDEAECRRLLATARIGRLGYTHGAMPAIVPVPVALHEQSVIIPAPADSSLLPAVRGTVVAVQVDSYRDQAGAGWSVTVVGPARVVRHAEAVAEIDALGLWPGGVSASEGFVAVSLAHCHGWVAARAGHPHLGG
jgi:nitroimidazol reductase NimA-like FMN-containing flavoprotein (pyridoxamine 5'-phosphate oxidase superfamily)